MDVRAVRFRVGPQWRVGALYSPSLKGSYPGILSLHGFPGVQKNEDIAMQLCRIGFVVFSPYFGGVWGSDGPFTMEGMLDDARAARALLRRYRHVDSGRVGVLGLSLGGWVALRTAAEHRFAAVAVMAPSLPKGGLDDRKILRRNRRVMAVPDEEELWQEYLRISRGDDPKAYLPKIAPTPLAFISGRRDPVTLPENIRKLYALARQPKELHELKEEEHEFQTDRAAVVKLVCSWFQRRLGAKPHTVVVESGH